MGDIALGVKDSLLGAAMRRGAGSGFSGDSRVLGAADAGGLG